MNTLNKKSFFKRLKWGNVLFVAAVLGVAVYLFNSFSTESVETASAVENDPLVLTIEEAAELAETHFRYENGITMDEEFVEVLVDEVVSSEKGGYIFPIDRELTSAMDYVVVNPGKDSLKPRLSVTDEEHYATQKKSN